jgi:hypothetical protein
VAADSTGTHLAAVEAFGGDVWTSTDSGATWTDRTPSGPAHGQYWVSVASDQTGANLVAVAGGGLAVAGTGSAGDIWTSSNSGATWTDRTSSGAPHDVYWASVASDSTGTNLVAVGAGIWTSINSGVTWNQQSAPAITGKWVSVASDATGTHLVAASGQVGGTGDIWTSVNSGSTWTNETTGTSAANQNWSAVASDSTGAHLVAVVLGGDIWTETNDAPVCATDGGVASCCCDGDVLATPTCGSSGVLTCSSPYHLYYGTDCTRAGGPCSLPAYDAGNAADQ